MPPGQDVQTVLAVGTQALETYDEAPHVEHVVQLPAAADDHLLAAQAVQEELTPLYVPVCVEYVPAEHWPHEEAPARLHLPGPHCMHSDAPASEYVEARQFTQADSDVRAVLPEYVPAGHGVQAAVDEACSEYEPTGHAPPHVESV